MKPAALGSSHPPNHLARFPLPGADFLVERRDTELRLKTAEIAGAEKI
jgi:hypothetical protein